MGLVRQRLSQSALVLVFALAAASAPRAASAQINVEWDESPSGNVAGYVAFVGTASGDYTYSYDVGGNTSFVFNDATPGQTYYSQ